MSVCHTGNSPVCWWWEGSGILATDPRRRRLSVAVRRAAAWRPRWRMATRSVGWRRRLLLLAGGERGVRGIVWTNSLTLLWSKAIYKVWKCKKSVGNSSSQVKQEHGPVIFSRHGEMLKRTWHSKFKLIIHRGKSVICCKLSLTIEKVKNAAQLVKTCITLRTSKIWL